MTDWGKLQSKVGQIAEDAGHRTDAKLAGELANVSRLTQDEIRRLFPDPADAKNLLELMRIIRAATTRNDKINRIVRNAEQFGGVILTLLTKLA
jgi:hypothetical protein